MDFIRRYLCMDFQDVEEPGDATRVIGPNPEPADTKLLREYENAVNDGYGRGIRVLQHYNRNAAPVKELVGMLVRDIQLWEIDFKIERHKLLGKGATGTVALSTCSTVEGDEAVIALKEMLLPEVWQPGNPRSSLEDALRALPLAEAAFQTVLTHNNIVEIYWADVSVIDPESRQPIEVRHRGGMRSLIRRDTIGSLSSGSWHSRRGSMNRSAASYVTLKMLLSPEREKLDLPKQVGFNMRIAMEFCELGALSHHLITRHNTPPPLTVVAGNMDGTLCAALTALDIARCLKLLHRVRIIHGDVKPHNILLTKRGVKSSPEDPRGFVAKLSDFGMSILQPDQTAASSIRQGSVEYMPHHNFQDAIVTFSTDVYALGIVMWELWHHHLWEDIYRKELNRQRFAVIDMASFRPQCNASCPPSYQALVNACLAPENQRLSISKVVQRLQNLVSEYSGIRTLTL